jgi:fructose-bisphosphate aldolase class II
MPIVNTKRMFEEAYDGGFAVGAFNVNNMELLQGIIGAVTETKAPLILQISRGARKYANMRYLRALIDAAVAENPEAPLVIHLDHGDFDTAMRCIDEGYTSVMYDGSHEPFEKNIENTRKIAEYAHAHDPYVCVEAELGKLGGIEEDVVGVSHDEVMDHLTDPNEVEQFVKESGCDSLAVAIGTSHGAYKFKHAPKLAFDRIDEIAKRVPGFPLVMHGSSSVPREFIDSINTYAVLQPKNKQMLKVALDKGWAQMPDTMGVPEEAITRASKMAVCKVNIDTDLRLALTASILKVWGDANAELMKWIVGGEDGSRPKFPFDPREYLAPGREAIKEMVIRKIKCLGADGKADLVK